MSERTIGIAVAFAWHRPDGTTEEIPTDQLSIRADIVEELSRLRSALSAATARGEKLAQFARWAIQEGPFSGYDLDGASVQEKAVSLGLIKREAYDPRKHGENADLVPGEDDYFTFDDALAALGDGE